jgi:hypothetical protein
MLNIYIYFKIDTQHAKPSPNGTYFGNPIIYYKNLWSKYDDFNFFFPLEYGEFGGCFSKINPRQGICKSMTRLTSSS